MKTKLYQKASSGKFKRFLFGLIKILMPEYFAGFSAESVAVIGRGVLLTNFVVQKILRVNGRVPFMVNYTSRITLWDAITIPRNLEDNQSIYESFASSGGCYFQAYNGIEFEGTTIWGPGVKFVSANHDCDDYAIHSDADPIHIGENVWIGANAVILPSVSIGNNSVVGAGAVVTRDVPANTIVAGNPARVINDNK